MNRTADQLIDQTLAALNHTQPDADLADRTRRALQQHPHRSVLAARNSFQAVFHHWLPVTAFAAAAILLALTLHHQRATPQTTTSRKAVTSSTTAWSSRPQAAPLAVATERRAASFNAADAHFFLSSHSPAKSPAVSNTTLSAEDALALEETRAPSLAPPSAPLTADEKLMQKLAHSGDLTQLASLEAPPAPTAAPPLAAIFARFALAAMSGAPDEPLTSEPSTEVETTTESSQ